MYNSVTPIVFRIIMQSFKHRFSTKQEVERCRPSVIVKKKTCSYLCPEQFFYKHNKLLALSKLPVVQSVFSFSSLTSFSSLLYSSSPFSVVKQIVFNQYIKTRLKIVS